LGDDHPAGPPDAVVGDPFVLVEAAADGHVLGEVERGGRSLVRSEEPHCVSPLFDDREVAVQLTSPLMASQFAPLSLLAAVRAFRYPTNARQRSGSPVMMSR